MAILINLENLTNCQWSRNKLLTLNEYSRKNTLMDSIGALPRLTTTLERPTLSKNATRVRKDSWKYKKLIIIHFKAIFILNIITTFDFLTENQSTSRRPKKSSSTRSIIWPLSLTMRLKRKRLQRSLMISPTRLHSLRLVSNLQKILWRNLNLALSLHWLINFKPK